MKHFQTYSCSCGVEVSLSGQAYRSHERGARHLSGTMRNILRELVKTVPNGCMHVSTELINSARTALRDADARS